MKKTILFLSLCGEAFSGYLSGVKLFTKTCAFGETCPYFLGYPACFFGFGLFSALTILSVVYVLKPAARKILPLISTVSVLGVVFAGYFTFWELPVLFSQGFKAYFFGLPTCALGLIFFLLILILSLKAGKED